jgi:hypothetical protein
MDETNEPTADSATLSDAERAPLRRFYEIELAGHTTGCCLRELGEDIRDCTRRIGEAEARIRSISEATRTQRDEQQHLAIEERIREQRRTIEGLKLRIGIIRPEHDRLEARAQSLWRTRDALARELAERGIIRRTEVRY